MIYVLLLALLAMPAIQTSAQNYVSRTNYTIENLEQSSRDSVEEVLNTWMQKRTQLEVVDPELGFSFIKLATAHEMDKYYEVANIMYNWALSAPITEDTKEVFAVELERLYPILSTQEYRKLKKTLKKDASDFGRQVKKIWDTKDPTPMTNYNERLIEHWERINYSIEKFSPESKTIKKADDRVEIYIKYGEPDRVEDGFLQYNSTEINSYIKARNGATTNRLQASLDNRIEAQARRLHNDAEYKIWVYNDINRRNNELFYLFGKDYNYKNFKLKSSISDFIPRSAFGHARKNTSITVVSSGSSNDSQQSDGLSATVNSNTVGGGSKSSISHPATPALLLMLSYTNQLSADVGFYGRFHNKLYNDYVDVTRNISETMDIEYNNYERNYIKKLDSFSPSEVSKEKEQIPQINNSIGKYRFVDEQGKPYVYVMANSNINGALMMDLRKNEQVDISMSDYEVKHGMAGYTEDDGLYFRNVIEAELYSKNSSKKVFAQSIFKVFYPDKEPKEIIFSSELHNKNEATKPVVETSYKPSLRGLGNSNFNLPKPLQPDIAMISDIILGYNYKSGEKAQFPFTISINKKIPADENLVFYFETYNLTPDSSGIYKGNLSYTLKKKKKGFSLFKNKKENLSITLNLQSKDPLYKDAIEIDTDKLTPGNYELTLSLNTGVENNFDRKVDFEVTKKE